MIAVLVAYLFDSGSGMEEMFGGVIVATMYATGWRTDWGG